MAIVKFGGGGGLERRVGIKAAKKAAKKGAKHAIEKHAAKKHPAKHPAKKHAEKHPGKKAAKKAAAHEASGSVHSKQSELKADQSASLSEAFHSLQRASALVSLLEADSGGDLRRLLELGISLYRTAAQTGGKDVALCATGLLKSAEHLAMAGLYTARVEHRVEVDAPDASEIRRHLERLRPRFEKLGEPEREQARRLYAMAKELLRRAGRADGKDPHLDYELTMAADGLCTALEQGL
jgi:hypothetical protein